MLEYIATKELKLVLDKKNPLYDERAEPSWKHKDWDAFVENIRVFGMQNSIIINEEKEIVEGRQRYKAAIELKLEEVPYVMTDPHENQVALSNSLNIHRCDDPPSLKAQKAVRMMLMNDQSKEDIAATFGCSVKQIDNYKKFMELDSRVRRAVDKDILSFTDAVNHFHGLTKADQHDLLEQVKEGAKLKEAKPGNGSNGDPSTKPLNASGNLRRAALVYCQSIDKHPKDPKKTSDKLQDNVVKSLQGVDVSDDFFEGMAFAFGYRPYTTIKGMADYLRNVQPKSRK